MIIFSFSMSMIALGATITMIGTVFNFEEIKYLGLSIFILFIIIMAIAGYVEQPYNLQQTQGK